MAFNIPLPGDYGTAFSQGVNSGGSLFSRIMQPVLEREKQRQAEAHFQEQLKLQKQAAARAGANSDLQRKLLMQKLDPMHEIKQLQLLNDYFSGGKGAQGQPSSQQSFLPSIGAALRGGNQPQGQGQFPALQERIMQGGMPQDNAIPQLNEQAVSPMEASAPQGSGNGLNMEAIKSSPILRGWFKKHFGIDPASADRGSAYTGSAREGLDLARLKKQFGENSEEYRNAEAISHAKEQQRKDLSEKRQRELHGLRPGDTPIIDPDTGEEIGYSKQLTKDQAMQEENKIKFDMLYPYVVEGASVFSGLGATKKLEQAARTYKTNPQSKKLIDDFLIAEKALTNTTVTEAARFGSGKQNQVFNRYRESLQASDIHDKLKKWIKEFEIPSEANRNAGRRWQKILDEVDNKSKKMVPARRSYFNDPEKQFQHDQEQFASQREKESAPDTIIVIDPSGKRFETTADNAAHLPTGWKRG